MYWTQTFISCSTDSTSITGSNDDTESYTTFTSTSYIKSSGSMEPIFRLPGYTNGSSFTILPLPIGRRRKIKTKFRPFLTQPKLQRWDC